GRLRAATKGVAAARVRAIPESSAGDPLASVARERASDGRPQHAADQTERRRAGDDVLLPLLCLVQCFLPGLLADVPRAGASRQLLRDLAHVSRRRFDRTLCVSPFA